MSIGKKIDISNIDLDDLKEKTVENPGLISFPHAVSGAIIKPMDKGKIKGRAMSAMQEQTDHQLKLLYEQMQTIVRQANEIKKRVKISERIYLAQMNFDPIISQTYYLYQRKDDTDVLSMISPDEWGKKIPFKSYLAKVKLLSDHTWDVLDSNNL